MPDNPLEALIVEEAHVRGPITFARFMELALYHPTLGYYSSGPDPIGAEGDFYTSPRAHPAFGALLSVQLADIWHKMGRPSPFYALELGSGAGVLAADILDFAPHLSSQFAAALEYLALDKRPTSVASETHSVVSDSLPFHGLVGCILSNEYLDAIPVHRVTVEGERLREIYVADQNGELSEISDEPSTPLLQQRLDDLSITLTEGQQAEINLSISGLTRSLSHTLDSGFVLTIDYGHRAADLYSTSRPNGTLACHYQHTFNSDPLRRIGLQDITAHVDFTSLVQIGEQTGLQHCDLVTQRQFLGNLGILAIRNGLRALGLPASRYNANLMGLGNLVDSQGLGGFKLCVQSKGVDAPTLSGLGGQGLFFDDTLPVPLLSDRHINLLAGKYPHMAWEPNQ